MLGNDHAREAAHFCSSECHSCAAYEIRYTLVMEEFARNVPPGPGNGKAVFLTWDPHCTRGENQARHFNAELLSISCARSIPTVIVTMILYVISLAMTLTKLWRAALFRISIPTTVTGSWSSHGGRSTIIGDIPIHVDEVAYTSESP